MTFNVDNFLQQNHWRLDEKKLIGTTFVRSVLPELLQALKDEKPVLVSGPRGAGKTTLLQMVVKHLITKKNILPSAIFYFNLDDILTRDATISADELAKFIRGFAPDTKQRLWVFLDEVLCLADNKIEPSEFIKELQKDLPKVKLVLTSSAKSPLTFPLPQGERDRAIRDMTRLEIGIVSYKEYLNRMFNPNNIYLPDGQAGRPRFKLPEKIGALTRSSYFKLAIPLLDEYLRYGGYARVVKEYTARKRPPLLRQVYQEQFTLNHFGFRARRDKAVLKPGERGKLLRELARMHGSILNVTKLSHETKLNHKTVYSFLANLESNYYINKVYPYLEKSKTEKGIPLVYFNDNGLRNMLIDTLGAIATRPDRKALLDNLLYNELRIIPFVKEIKFWISDTSEVTAFVFKHGVVQNLIGVLYDFPQAKSGRWALVNFGRRIKAKKIIILTRDYARWETVGPTTIIYLPVPMTWLLPECLSSGVT